MRKTILSLQAATLLLLFIASLPRNVHTQPLGLPYSEKPYTRWWWFASEIDTNDVKYQLDWLKANNFGGVEVAFVYPLKGDSTAKRFAWLSTEWSSSVAFAKSYSDRIGLGCDFTFGTLWPFGDSRVPAEDGTLFYGDTTTYKTMRLTWEMPSKGRVINHLDKNALINYSRRIGKALMPAMKGSASGLFCDSWEVETVKLWTNMFDIAFQKKFGYDIRPFMDSLYKTGYERKFYDYTTLISENVLNEFYKPFTEISHNLGGISRAQCGGAPADLLNAFAAVDVPETEAILYEPNFALIPASAAVLSKKPVISSETFTCMYGWKRWPGPGPYQKQEQIADMKLIADALFANGVNLIFWHGMPYNKAGDTNMFYASVHVGPDAFFARQLPDFNKYMEKISGIMRKGSPYTDIAVYLPTEDAWMAAEYPDSLKFPWVWGQYEMRYVYMPKELNGYQPTWINKDFLAKSELKKGLLHCGDAVFSSLYIDVKYMDLEALKVIYKLASQGFPVCIKTDPVQPGDVPDKNYSSILKKLKSLRNVQTRFKPMQNALVSGIGDLRFRCRIDGDTAYLFFPNPASEGLRYPQKYLQGYSTENISRKATVRLFGRDFSLDLNFAPMQSLMYRLAKDGSSERVDIQFIPELIK